jgi:4-amino-4-deoxy-L-arabinose transferase-like glycosyltransferase
VSLRSPFTLLTGIFGGILLALFGLVLMRGRSFIPGLLLTALAVALFLVSSQRLRTAASPDADLPAQLRKRLPLALIGLAFFFCLLAVYEVSQPRTISADLLSAASWLVSILCLAVGVLWWEHWRPSLSAMRLWLAAHRREAILVGGIFAAALAARLVLLAQHPYPWSGDEASVGMEARRILSGENLDVFNAGWSGQPNLSFVPTALALAVLGDTLFAIRLSSALIGALSVVTLYLAARALFDRTVATIAAAFLVAFPFHLQFSRIGVSNIVDAFMVTLCLWLTVRAVQQETLRAFLWAGLATGLALYTYVGSRLVIALGIATLAYYIIRHRGYLRRHIWHLGGYAAGLVVMAAPMAYFMFRHPDIFMTRVAQTGIMFNGWLPHEAAVTGKGVLGVLLDQFWRSTLVFIAQGAPGNFFNSPQPYLNLFGSLFFLIGMGLALQHLLDFPYTVVLLWFWAVVFLGGVLTLDPPANTRLVMSTPAVAIFLALGMQQVLKVLEEIKITGRWRTVAAAMMVGLLLAQNAMYYFGPYRTGHYFADANSEMAEAVGMELQSLGPRYHLLMMGQPRVYSGFPTISFLAPHNTLADVDPAQVDAVDLTGLRPTLLVATPDNLSAIRSLAQRYPGGKWQEVPRQTEQETLYYAYVLGPESTP